MLDLTSVYLAQAVLQGIFALTVLVLGIVGLRSIRKQQDPARNAVPWLHATSLVLFL
jgi:uncharacterized membrane protein YfcA